MPMQILSTPMSWRPAASARGEQGGTQVHLGSQLLRRDVREIVKPPPVGVFRRQVSPGASLFSRAEAAGRHDIGVDKICIGMDYPHTRAPGAPVPAPPTGWRATLARPACPRGCAAGSARTPSDCGDSTGLALRAVADDIGPDLELVLTPPTEDHFPRGTSTSRSPRRSEWVAPHRSTRCRHRSAGHQGGTVRPGQPGVAGPDVGITRTFGELECAPSGWPAPCWDQCRPRHNRFAALSRQLRGVWSSSTWAPRRPVGCCSVELGGCPRNRSSRR